MRRGVLLAIMAMLVLPVYFMVIGSLQDVHGVLLMPPRLIPLHPTDANWSWLFNRPYLLRWVGNSAIVATSIVGLSVFLSVTAAYAFAFFDWRGKKALWIALLVGIMIPRISLLIPLFVVVRKLGLSGTLAATVVPVAFSPVGLYLARVYFETIPRSMLESARIDGAGEFQVLARIVMPLAKPIVTTLALYAGIQALGDFLWQMLQLQMPRRMTAVVGITREVMRRGDVMMVNPLGQAMAGGTFLLVPLLLIFLAANRYFTTALGGALKE